VHGDGGWGWWKLRERSLDDYLCRVGSLARDADRTSAGNNYNASRAASFLDKEIVEEEENPDMQA
jgi:hypothetical protein